MLGLSSYFRGILFVLFRISLWKYLFLQLFITSLVLAVVATTGTIFYQKNIAVISGWIAKWLSIFGLSLLCLVVFLTLNSIFSKFLLYSLSQKIEKIVSGEVSSYPNEESLMASITKLPITLITTIIELAISFVPIAGQWWGGYKVGRETVNLTLHRKMSKEESSKICSENHITLVAFGLISSAAILLFPLTLFYGIFRVAGGTLLALDLCKNSKIGT